MTEVVILHVKTVPNVSDVTKDGRVGRRRAHPCTETSKTQGKAARRVENKPRFNSESRTG